jgi:hypothetical protein
VAVAPTHTSGKAVLQVQRPVLQIYKCHCPNYAPGVLTATTWYRRVVQSGGCTDNSAAVQIIVNPVIAGNTITYSGVWHYLHRQYSRCFQRLHPCGGAGTNTYTYQWERSTTSATSGFAAITNNSTATTKDYTPSQPLTGTTWYRRITSSGGCSNSSTAVQITVSVASVGGTTSGSTTVCAPANSTTLTVSGHMGTVIRWQSSTVSDFSSAVTDIANTTTTITATNLSATTYYRAVVQSGACAPANSATSTITVTPASVGGSAPDQVICSGATPQDITITGFVGNVTKWQKSTGITFPAGSSTSDISITSTTLTSANIGSLTTTTHYRAFVQTGSCTFTNSATITVTVNPVISSNTLTAAQTICTGTAPIALTGSTPTGGNGSYTYQWQSSAASATGSFSDISGATLKDFAPGTLTANTWYRRIVTSGPCTDISTSVQITVSPVITGNTVTADQAICTGTTPASLAGSLPTGGSGSYAYQWQSGTTSATAGFTNITGATAKTMPQAF